VGPIFESVLKPRILAALRRHARSLEPSARQRRWHLIRQYARDTHIGCTASILDLLVSKGDGETRTFKRKRHATEG
jgi:hypothetical protein